VGQKERRQVVDREPQLVPVGTELPRRSGRPRPDAGVVDKHVDVLLSDSLAEAADLLERGEVGVVVAQFAVPGRPGQFFDRRLPFTGSRPCRSTVAPIAARSCAALFPMPSVEPVTRTVICSIAFMKNLVGPADS